MEGHLMEGNAQYFLPPDDGEGRTMRSNRGQGYYRRGERGGKEGAA